MHPDVLRRATRFAALAVLLLAAPAPGAAQPFTFRHQGSALDDAAYGTGLWGDYDGDGDHDLLLAGDGRAAGFVRLYRYDGLVTTRTSTTVSTEALFEPVQDFDVGPWYGGGAWGDYDRDGDLDLVLFGASRSAPPHQATSGLFRNDEGSFVRVGAGLPGFFSGAAAWGDYDNDGDLDLLLTGALDDETPHTDVYRNDGGAFTPVGADLPPLFGGSAAWGDHDADGDLDLLLTGATGLATGAAGRTEVYRNEAGVLTPHPFARLPGLLFGEAVWADYDEDGLLDVLATGARYGPAVLEGYSRIFRNTGASFRPDAPALSLRGVFYGGASWADIDSDGRADVVLTGYRQPLAMRVGRVYLYDPENASAGYRHAANLPGLATGTHRLADLDGDEDLDLLLTGADGNQLARTMLFMNDERLANERPTPPGSLQALPGPGLATLSWEAATDGQTASAALTYNLRVGTTPGGGDVVSPMADAATGRRLLSAMGNAGHATNWTLRGLPTGTYYWSVQTLDAAYAASPFAAEGTFTVSVPAQTSTGAEAGPDLPREIALHPPFPNPFRDAASLIFDLPRPADVTVEVYNVLGERVHTLAAGPRGAGRHVLSWQGTDDAGLRLGSGVYFCRLQVGGRLLTRAMLLVR